MAIVLSLSWAGVTPDEYDELLNVVDWERQPAEGGIFHLAWFDDEGLRAVDVWETPQDWEVFLQTRLTPGLEKIGVHGEPKIEIAKVHRYFDTAYGHRAG